jgi:hypothetical protein
LCLRKSVFVAAGCMILGLYWRMKYRDTMNEYIIRNAVQELLRGELVPDEEILWVDQPDPSVIFTNADIFLVPFSVFWGGFAVFWECAALFMPRISNHGMSAPLTPFPLFGLPFVLIGFYFIFGRFIYKKWKKQHTYYAVTNKRAIILSDTNRGNIKAIRINTLQGLSRNMRSDGHGSISFGEKSGYPLNYGNTGLDFFSSAYGEPPLTFYDIKNAGTVYELVNKLMYEKDPGKS